MSLSISSQIQESLEFLVNNLLKLQIKLATAESCTGGMLAQHCTALDGSSKWFECGFITYSNASKIRMLGIESNVLDEYGAVSNQVAEQMALGALNKSNADIAVSITGIAGPTGGGEIKPVGTVYIGISKSNQQVCSFYNIFDGNRNEVRLQTTLRAIQLLIEYLENE